MKQGRASSSGMGSTKREPVSHAVQPRAAANIGLKHGNMTDCGPIPFKTEPLYSGAGLKAPMARETTHPKGSQGRH